MVQNHVSIYNSSVLDIIYTDILDTAMAKEKLSRFFQTRQTTISFNSPPQDIISKQVSLQTFKASLEHATLTCTLTQNYYLNNLSLTLKSYKTALLKCNVHVLIDSCGNIVARLEFHILIRNQQLGKKTVTDSSQPTKSLIKTYRKVIKPSNLTDTNSLAQGQTLLKYGFPCTLWVGQGLLGVKVKCTVAILVTFSQKMIQFCLLVWFFAFTLATNTQPSAYGAYQSQANRWPYNYNYNSYKYRNYNFQNSAAKRPYNGKRRNVTVRNIPPKEQNYENLSTVARQFCGLYYPYTIFYSHSSLSNPSVCIRASYSSKLTRRISSLAPHFEGNYITDCLPN